MQKKITGLVALLGFLPAGHLLAQEAIQQVLSSRAISGTSAFENQPYTFKAQDLRVHITPSMGAEYNDNINISNRGRGQDYILKPMVDVMGIYPWTDRNVVTFNVGVGYEQYIDHDDYSGLLLTSGSGIGFDFGVGDFQFNLHDRFSYSQDAAGQSAIAGNGKYGTAQNLVGILGSWDLGDVIPSIGYDHLNLMSTSKTSDQYKGQDHSSDMFVERVAVKVYPEVVTGLETSESMTSYDKQRLNDSTTYTVGTYAIWKKEAFSLEPRVGYSYFQFDKTSSYIQSSSSGSWYGDLTGEYIVSKAITAGISAGHEVNLGVESDAIEIWYVRPHARWGFTERGNVNLGFSYENGKQGFGDQNGGIKERYNHYGPNLGVDYRLTKKLVGNLYYQLTMRDSDSNDRNYSQNLVGVRFSYPLD